MQNSEQLIEENIPKNNEFQGELKLNTKYYIAGKDGNAYAIFYSDGSGEYAGETIEYSNNNGIVEFSGIKFEIKAEGESSILISEPIEVVGRFLLATSMDGLRYFSGERYENQEGAYTSAIILNADRTTTRYNNDNRDSEFGISPVLYKGILCLAGTAYIDEDRNVAFITTNDNCETLIINGKVYTKVTE